MKKLIYIAILTLAIYSCSEEKTRNNTKKETNLTEVTNETSTTKCKGANSKYNWLVEYKNKTTNYLNINKL